MNARDGEYTLLGATLPEQSLVRSPYGRIVQQVMRRVKPTGAKLTGYCRTRKKIREDMPHHMPPLDLG